MIYIFRTLASASNTTSGVAEKIFFAPVAWFTKTGIKAPDAGGVAIVNNHQFLPGKGFLTIALAPEKNELTGKTIGDTMFQKMDVELSVFLPGSYVQLHEFVANAINIPVIALIQDATCAGDEYYQVGTNCNYAYLVADFSTGTTKAGVKGYECKIKATHNAIQLYSGTVLLYGDTESGLPAGAIITEDGRAILSEDNKVLIAE
jgi:hypothetical protein